MPETVNTLRSVPLLRGLEADALAKLAQGADRKAYAAGEYLFHAGAQDAVRDHRRPWRIGPGHDGGEHPTAVALPG